LHWGYEDPAEAVGTDEQRLAVFRRVFLQLSERIATFAAIAQRQPV
jgi:arsenate reductase